MQQLLVVDRLDLHENPEGFIAALVLANGEGLSAFRGTLVNDPELRRWMLAEKVPEHEFRLGLAVRLHLAFNGYVYCLKQVSRKLLRTPRLDRFPDLGNDIVLPPSDKHL